MHSLQPNRTIPYPLKPTRRLPLTRSRTLPSLPPIELLLSERASGEGLCEGAGVGVAAEVELEGWAGGAEKS
jgi:hypothetical protein